LKQLHHLYGIFEKDTDDVFKYGISDDPMGEDGLSNRVRAQVRFANLAAGFLKFFAKILMFNIPGRAKTEEIEREHIEVYRQKNGQKPSGNLR